MLQLRTPGSPDYSAEFWLAMGNLSQSEAVIKLLKGLSREEIISSRDSKNRTLLHVATHCGNTQVIEHLLGVGVDLNGRDNRGDTSLMYALRFFRSYRVVEILLNAGIDVGMANITGPGPLSFAVEMRDTRLLALLADAMLAEGSTVELLADKLLRVNCPLVHAMSLRDIGVMVCMIRGGANINQRASLDGACRDESPLGRAIAAGDLDQLRLLLTSGANVRATDSRGITPLHEAVYGGIAHSRFMTLMLLDYGAPVNAPDYDGFRALHKAAFFGNVECQELLLHRGAEVNVTEAVGNTPLHLALFNPLREPSRTWRSVTLLLRHGADAMAINKMGSTVLRQAARMPEVEPACLIIKHMVRRTAGGEKMHKADVDLLAEKQMLLEYYNQCEEEIKRMRDCQIFGKITLLNVFVDPMDRVTKYINNEDLAEIFEEGNCESLYPIYGDWLRTQYEKSRQSRMLFDEAVELLSQLLVIDDPFCVIARKIVGFLNPEDIKTFIATATV